MGDTMGIIGFLDMVSNWAIEFFAKNQNTDWENLIENGAPPLSKKMKSVSCWDDAIIDYGWSKFEGIN